MGVWSFKTVSFKYLRGSQAFIRDICSVWWDSMTTVTWNKKWYTLKLKGRIAYDVRGIQILSLGILSPTPESNEWLITRCLQSWTTCWGGNAVIWFRCVREEMRSKIYYSISQRLELATPDLMQSAFCTIKANGRSGYECGWSDGRNAGDCSDLKILFRDLQHHNEKRWFLKL